MKVLCNVDNLTEITGTEAKTGTNQNSPVGQKSGTTSLSAAYEVQVSVCIPNWNCRNYLRNCLISLRENLGETSFEVIVVDNGSRDGAVEMVRDEFPEVKLIQNAKNVGFARASNQAAEAARGKYLFFLNNDTILPPETIGSLYEFAELHPVVGMFGPKLIDGSGHTQISYRQKPSVVALLHRTSIFRWTGLLKRLYYRYRREQFNPEVIREVECLMGAAIFMRRSIFNMTGRWDEDFTFGGEDIEFSTRVNKYFRLYYVPSIAITHFGRVGSRQNVTFSAPKVIVGYLQYFRKTGISPLSIFLYKIVVTLETPIHLLTKFAQYLYRKLTFRNQDAEKSLLIVRGLWAFLTRDLFLFWRT